MMGLSQPLIVVLDGYDLNIEGVTWAPLEGVGISKIYDHSSPDQIVERSKGAMYIVVNKVIIDSDVIAQLPSLRGIFVSATGFNNIDIQTARKHHVDVCNVQGYGSSAVAQHVFAMIMQITNRINVHNAAVKNGEWSRIDRWSFWKEPTIELKGKTMGILGYGKIGKCVAALAKAFEMKVVVTSRSKPTDVTDDVSHVSFDELLAQSDILSLNAPLTGHTKHIMNREAFHKMKSNAILINTSRGGLINEAALYQALAEGQIGYAGLDVLDQEPPPQDHPLLALDNCIITPHMAWVSRETRQRLLDEVISNIQHHLKGSLTNLVN